MLAGQDLSFAQAMVVSVVGILVVMIELAILAVLVYLLSRLVRAAESKLVKAQPEAGAPAEPQGVPLPADSSRGELKLTDVDEPTAAAIMAIVSHRSGIDLNRLNFKSIRLLKDDENREKVSK